MEATGLIVWLIVGAIAGWLAGKVMSGRGFGLLGDIVVGIIGAIIGNYVFSTLGGGPSGGVIGSIFVAFVGAMILLIVLRLLVPRGRFGI